MCVIFIAYDQHPTDDMVAADYDHNPHGAGAAWRENGWVNWEKGLKLDQILQRYKELPLPYILHFRIPSCGPDIGLLCHPFPITREVKLQEKGRVRGTVLFHNGHWNPWRDELKDAAFKSRLKLPPDVWSDSRAMAWLAANFGMGILELIPANNKLAILPPEGEIQTFGDEWKLVDGIWCSNDYWTYGRAKSARRELQRPKGPTTGAGDNYHTSTPHSILPHARGVVLPPVGPEADPAAALAASPAEGSPRGATQPCPFPRAEDLEKMEFKEVDRLFRLGIATGEKIVSKNAWKRSRRAWEATNRSRWPWEAKDYQKGRGPTEQVVEKHLRIEEAIKTAQAQLAEEQLDSMLRVPLA